MLRKLKNLIILIIILSQYGNKTLYAVNNTIKFDKISIDKGLSQVSVFAIVHDSKGFMWFGTLDGLNRFDGYDFNVYRHKNSDSSSLSNNTVVSIVEDDSSNLWIGTFDGLNYYNRKTESFNCNNIFGSGNPLPNRVIRCMSIINNYLWVGTDNGLCCINLKNKKVVSTFKPSNILSDFRIYSFSQDNIGNLWLGTNEGLYRFSFNTKKFFKIDIPVIENAGLKDANIIRVVHVSKNGLVWAGSNGSGLYCYNPINLTLNTFLYQKRIENSIADNVIRAIIEDNKGNLWIGTYGGLSYFNQSTSLFTNYTANSADFNAISSNKVISLLEDRNGILWIGTYGSGLNQINQKKYKFYHFQPASNLNLNGLSSGMVLSFLIDKNKNLYVGTDNGLNIIEPNTKKIRVIKNISGNANSLSNNVIRAMFQDDDGKIYIGTENGGLNIYNPNTQKFISFKNDPDNINSITHNGVLSIFKDSYKRIWVGTYRGLNNFNPRTQTFKRYNLPQKTIDKINDSVIFKIFEDSQKRLWICSSFGLLQYDRNVDEIIKVAEEPLISSNFVRDILEDKNGNIWLATSEGLNLIDPITKKVIQFRNSEGLPNDLIYGMVLEKNNANIWLSTNYGLSRFNMDTQHFQNFNANDGLQSNEFNQGAAYQGSDGNFYFGGVNGFNYFNPQNFAPNSIPPKVVFTEFQLFNDKVVPSNSQGIKQSITEIEQINLTYKDLVFSFKFAALNFINPEKSQYAYKLEGFDKNWNYINNRRFVTYTNIPPGEYEFKVIAANNDGVWNTIPKTIKVVIKPPIWKTTWFYLLVFFVTIISLYLFIKLRERKLEKQNRKLESRVAVRTSEILQQKEEIESQRAELEYINQTLEHLVADEIRKNREKDVILIQQSRQAVMGEMIGNIAHQWRQPLNAIGVIIQNFQDAYDFGELDHDYIHSKVNKAMEIVQYMSQTIDDFRYFFKSDKLSEEFNVKDVIQKAISFVEANLKNNSIVLDTVLEDVIVNGYPNEYAQTVLNILNNAKDILLERKIENPIIMVRLFSKDNKSIVTIADNAGGIKEENLNRIFDPYFTTKDSQTGTGLGLYMAKTIIEKNMDGQLLCENADGGAKFTIIV